MMLSRSPRELLQDSRDLGLGFVMFTIFSHPLSAHPFITNNSDFCSVLLSIIFLNIIQCLLQAPPSLLLKYEFNQNFKTQTTQGLVFFRVTCNQEFSWLSLTSTSALNPKTSPSLAPRTQQLYQCDFREKAKELLAASSPRSPIYSKCWFKVATWLKCFQTAYLDPKSVNGYVVMASVNYYAFWELFESQYLSLNIMILCLLCHRWDKGNLCKKEHEDLSFLLFWNGTANGKLWGLSYTTNRNRHLNVFLYSIHILFNTARKAVINLPLWPKWVLCQAFDNIF